MSIEIGHPRHLDDVLPVEWSVRTLGEIAKIERVGVSPEDIKRGTLFVGLEHIESGGDLLAPESVVPGDIASTKFQFDQTHVLYGKLRPYLAKIALPDFAGICSTDILPIKPGPDLDRRYLAYYLRQPSMVSFATSRTSGANLPRLSPTALAEFPVPMPPLAEQLRIAGILDAADGLRAKRRESINLLDSLTQSIFLDRFGDPMRNPKGLPTAPLNTLVRRITDGTHQSPEWSETGVPFLFVSNIASGRISYETEKYISEQTHATLTRRCPIELGDVLYSTVGTYGVPVVVEDPRPFAFQRHIAHIKPDPSRIDPHFLKVMLASPGVKAQADSQARGVAQKTVNLGSIQEFVVFDLPLAEQLSASEIFSAIERERERQVASLFALELIFASLQSRAFHGDL